MTASTKFTSSTKSKSKGNKSHRKSPRNTGLYPKPAQRKLRYANAKRSGDGTFTKVERDVPKVKTTLTMQETVACHGSFVSNEVFVAMAMMSPSDASSLNTLAKTTVKTNWISLNADHIGVFEVPMVPQRGLLAPVPAKPVELSIWDSMPIKDAPQHDYLLDHVYTRVVHPESDSEYISRIVNK